MQPTAPPRAAPGRASASADHAPPGSRAPSDCFLDYRGNSSSTSIASSARRKRYVNLYRENQRCYCSAQSVNGFDIPPPLTAGCRRHMLAYDPSTNPLNNNEWSFPLLEIIHIASFAVSIGTIFIVDLRLLGIGMRRQTSAQLLKDTAPWTLVALAIVLMS